MRSEIVQPWGAQWNAMVEQQDHDRPETPRERLAREHADFIARGPIREVVEHIFESSAVWECSVRRVRLSCGHTQSHTERERIRCVHCWRAMGPVGHEEQAELFGGVQ